MPSTAEPAPGSPGAVVTMNGDAQTRAEHAAEQLRAPLARYAAHLLGGDHGLGQDVAQDCFEKLLRKPPAGLSEMTDGRLKAWLYTVCRNRALDLRRKDRRMTAMPTPSFERDWTPSSPRSGQRTGNALSLFVVKNDRDWLPKIGEMRDYFSDKLGRSMSVHRFALPSDTVDHFAAAGWAKPELYLNETFRSGISSFARLDEQHVGSGLAQLSEDLDSGAWDRKFGYLRNCENLDVGYVFLEIIN